MTEWIRAETGFTANIEVHYESIHLCSCFHHCFAVNCLILCSCHVFSDIFLPYLGEFSIKLILPTSNYKLVQLS